MITLYHGSNVFIEKIDLTRSHPDKDFGKGLYMAESVVIPQKTFF